MDGFRFVRQQEVEFRDLDGLGHVNNAVYLSYVESARLDYLRRVLGIRSLHEIQVIVARVAIDFRSPALLGEVLEVGARVPRLGSKSLEMEHEIRGADGRLVAHASSVLVAFDFDRRASMSIPSGWRERIESFEAERVAAA